MKGGASSERPDTGGTGSGKTDSGKSGSEKVGRARRWKVWLGGVVIFTIVVAGGVFGWYLVSRQKFTLDTEYVGSAGWLDLDAAGYEKLVSERKTAVIFADSTACTTADRMRGFLEEISEEKQVLIYRMMWPEVLESSLHAEVKYYPSVVILRGGQVVDFLKADKDEHGAIYNDKALLLDWLEQYLQM